MWKQELNGSEPERRESSLNRGSSKENVAPQETVLWTHFSEHSNERADSQDGASLDDEMASRHPWTNVLD